MESIISLAVTQSGGKHIPIFTKLQDDRSGIKYCPYKLPSPFHLNFLLGTVSFGLYQCSNQLVLIKSDNSGQELSTVPVIF